MTVFEAAPGLRDDDTLSAGSRSQRSPMPPVLVAAGAVIGIASSQGGYFPSSWGLGATLLLWTIGVWFIVSAGTDAGRVDAVYLGLLTGLACWIGVSIAWSAVPAQSVLELERTVLLLVGVTAVLALATRAHVSWLASVLLASISLVSAYALATRLFPDRLGQFDSIAGYRLADPLGYWNSLGIFSVMGVMLALGFAADATARMARAAAAASVVVLLTTVYFTFSRGSWIALGFAVCLFVAVTPRRLRTIAALTVALAPAAVGILVASRSYALTHVDVSLARASADGHRFALVLLALAGAAATLIVLLDVAQRRVAMPRGASVALGVVLLVGAVAVPTALVVREGGPVALARDAWHAFGGDLQAPPGGEGDLNRRLFSFAGNGRVELWTAAKDLYVDHPAVGSGAGTFERYWQGRADASFKVRDAHSLYVETLAELGPPGLALLAAALLVPLGAGLSVRRRALLPAAVAAYAAFLVHAGVDWDWELSGVTLTALLVGCVCVVAARRHGLRTLTASARTVGCVAILVASVATTFVFLGNGALDRAQEAVSQKHYFEAVEEANRARRLMPWSPWPLITRGDAQLAAGVPGPAAASYRHAIAIDPKEWRAWLGLAFATQGSARASALARARRLYPRSREIESAVSKLEDGTKR
jgi:hypothetical protein